MRHLLLGSSALLGVAMFAQPSLAAEPIKLVVGGYFKEAYLAVFDDGDEDELGKDHAADGFFNDAEIHFTGSTVLDNGLEVGARIELEGETDGDQIDEAWVWFSGGFGELRFGSDDEALANACIVPPGGTGNFSAFSPNQWGANGAGISGLESNTICTGVDDDGDAQKVVYITPSFSGFQLTVSYTPNSIAETHVDGAGPHLGMPEHVTFTSRHNVSVYGTYAYDGEDWGLTAGLGGSWEGHREEGGTDLAVEESAAYQAGLNLSFGNFSFGVAGEYFDDVLALKGSNFSTDVDVWVIGAGAAYTMDAWTLGLQYSHQDAESHVTGALSAEDTNFQQDRVVTTVTYAMGPGITVDGELGYTWIDLDPEVENANLGLPDGLDDYDAVEIGIGTTITF